MTSGFEPLKQPLFRDRWIASIVSNMGGWMQDTAGTWLMTSLTRSPLLIAMMQTVASLPVLLLALLAGATADIYDRRRLLLFWQAWQLVTVVVLGVLTLAGYVSPWWLLGLTFVLNLGAAMNNPAWQAIVPELVPREQLADAIALNSAGFNLSRALGPALGGIAVAAFGSRIGLGSAVVFFLNGASFMAVLWVLYRWRRTPLFKSALPSERIAGSVRAGLRYLRNDAHLRTILLRAFAFTFFLSAVWALLAVVAAHRLHQGALGYGILNGSIGIGAVGGAVLLPRVRRSATPNTIVAVSTLISVATLAVLAVVPEPWIIVPMLLACGLAWTSTTSTFNLAVQTSVPSWVVARALGAYQTIFQGGMALGSILWGWVADRYSASEALLMAAMGLLISLPVLSRMRPLDGEAPDFSPHQLADIQAQMVLDPRPHDGPVRVTVDFKVALEDYRGFTHAIHHLRDVRLRDGAIRWGVFQDVADPEHFSETFVMESWLEYLRQRERFTAYEIEIRDRVWSFHKGPDPPHVSRMIYARELEDGE